jgi:hypothetical protein
MDPAVHGVTEKPKRKKPVTLGHRTLEWLRQHDFLGGVVERKQLIPDRKGGVPQFVKGRPKMIPITWDLFGFADIVAVSTNPEGPPGTLYIQVTDRGNAAARINKLLTNDKVEPVIRAGNRVWVMA